jgi:hypothetical protein
MLLSLDIASNLKPLSPEDTIERQEARQGAIYALTHVDVVRLDEFAVLGKGVAATGIRPAALLTELSPGFTLPWTAVRTGPGSTAQPRKRAPHTRTMASVSASMASVSASRKPPCFTKASIYQRS